MDMANVILTLHTWVNMAFIGESCVSFHISLFSKHILLHISVQMFTYIYNSFFEYNHVSTTNLKQPFFGNVLICQHTTCFNLENCSPAWCLIIAQIVAIILHKVTICTS